MPVMADRDAAFLWETEVLRTSSKTRPSSPPPGDVSEGDWLTLRQASEETGLPVSTLRNWARKGRIPTTLEDTPSGPRRMVSLQGVRERARRLGHGVEGGGALDRGPVAEPGPAEPVAPGQVSPPSGTMLVPIDAWDKMLIQLGNLHQAGQQLAEARERAARAETEAEFLRERLAELREAKPGAEEESGPGLPAGDAPSDRDETEPVKPSKMPSFTAYLWRMAVSERRRR
jgi:DNA-binding transcriptional MerR regulator